MALTAEEKKEIEEITKQQAELAERLRILKDKPEKPQVRGGQIWRTEDNEDWMVMQGGRLVRLIDGAVSGNKAEDGALYESDELVANRHTAIYVRREEIEADYVKRSEIEKDYIKRSELHEVVEDNYTRDNRHQREGCGEMPCSSLRTELARRFNLKY